MPELAEGARLEIVCSGYPGTVGSNPTLSAISTFLRRLIFASSVTLSVGVTLQKSKFGFARLPVDPE